MSPDAPFTDQHAADPQSWNLYSYVGNNPLGHVDPDGHRVRDTMVSSLIDAEPFWGGANQGAGANGSAEMQENEANYMSSVTEEPDPGNAEAAEGGEPAQQNTNQTVGKTTEGSLAKVLTNEIGSLSTPKGGDPTQFQDGAEALANALINNANKKKPNGVAPDTGTASPALADAMQNAVTNRANGAADPVEGRTFYGTSHTPPDRLQSRPTGNGRQSVYSSFGPFKDSTSKQQTYIYIYNDPGQ